MSNRLFLTVYDPDDLPTEEAHIASKSLGTIDEASSLIYTHHLHGAGYGKVRIARHHAQAALLLEDRYCIVHSDIGPVGGILLEKGEVNLSDADEEGGEFLTMEGRGAMGVLERAVMDTTSSITGGQDPIEGFWDLSNQGDFAGASNGHPIPMMKRVLNEVQANTPDGIPMVDHSSWDYDADSDATTPPFWGEIVWGADIGNDALGLAARMSQLGSVVWQMSHLFAFDAFLTYGTDRSGAFATDTVRFEKGVNVATSVTRLKHGNVRRTHLIVGGADRTYVTAVDPDYTPGDPVYWGFLSVGETADTAALGEAGLANIAGRKRQTDAWELPLHAHGDDPANGVYEPGPPGTTGAHYWVGDLATGHTGTGADDANEATLPIAAITWELLTEQEGTGDYRVVPEVGSTFNWSGGPSASFGSDCCSGPGSQHRFQLCRDDGDCIETFTRTVDPGWGVSEVQEGETWSADPAFEVNGTAGIIQRNTADPAVFLTTDWDLPVELLIKEHFERDGSPTPSLHGFYAESRLTLSSAVAPAGEPNVYIAFWYEDGTLSGLADSLRITLRGRRSGQDLQDTAGATFDAREEHWVRVRFEQDTLYGRMWLDGDPEPGTWDVTRALTGFPADYTRHYWQALTGEVGSRGFVTGVRQVIDSYQVIEPCEGLGSPIVGGPFSTAGVGTKGAPCDHDHKYTSAQISYAGDTVQAFLDALDTGVASPWEEVSAAIWKLITGVSVLQDENSEAFIEFVAGWISLRAFTDGGILLEPNNSVAGGGDFAKVYIDGGHGLVLQVLSADPAAGASEDGQIYYNDVTETIRQHVGGAWSDMGSGGVDLSAIDFLVGTASGDLSAEIVVGATPGGELGGTWAAPTVGATHSGSAHHTENHASRHADGGADEVAVEGLPTAETDTALVLHPDGTGGIEWGTDEGGSGIAGELVTDTIVGDGVEDTFALSAAPTGSWALVSTNGADLLPTEYAIVAGDIVFDVAPVNLSEVLVTFIVGGFTGAAVDPSDIVDPTIATAEDVALKLNALMANLRTAGIIA